MASRLTKKEYFVLGFIVILFFLSAGKYYIDAQAYQDLGKNVQFTEDKIRNEVYTLSKYAPERSKFEYQLSHNDEGWALFQDGLLISDISIDKNVDGKLIFTFSSTTPTPLVVEVKGIDSLTRSGTAYHSDIPHTYSPGNMYLVFEQEDALPIFGYHNVISDSAFIQSPSLDIHQKDFAEQIRFATEEMNCVWYTFGKIMEDYISKDRKTPKNACVVTFDDGRSNNYNYALPILEKYNVPASFFIIAGRPGTSATYMNWEEIGELYRSGHEIGSHGLVGGGLVNTDWYDGVFDDSALKHEVKDSKKEIEKRGIRVSTFAYPLGEWDESVVKAAKDAGYVGARDISRDFTWLDQRTPSASTDPEYIWHMAYFKPEQATTSYILKNLSIF